MTEVSRTAATSRAQDAPADVSAVISAHEVSSRHRAGASA
jgi:hypothetical protein